MICLSITADISFAEPGWKMGAASQVSPDEARRILESKAAKPLTSPSVAQVDSLEMKSMGDGLSTSETEITPEIDELARALQHDPKLIFDYVRNNIEYVPTYGSVNGATATLLAGRGNDWDQASLLIALLRASGYTANYNFATVTYVLNDVAAWLGVDEDPGVVNSVFARGGIPAEVFQVTLYYVRMDRIWVKVEIDGNNYWFDPSFKISEVSSSIDLESAMGYSQSTFLTSAGGTFGSDWVENMNEGNIRSELQNHSLNLVDYIKNNHPNKPIQEIIGGKRIIPEEMGSYPSSLPYAIYVESPSDWSEIPSNYCLKITIQHRKFPYINREFKSWEIAGKRVTIFYTGAYNAPELRVDGELISTGIWTVLGNTYDLDISIDHPYPQNGGSFCDNSETFPLISGNEYNISIDFGTVSQKLIETRKDILFENRLSGSPDQSEDILGESLHIMGLTWFHECRMTEELAAKLAKVSFVTHHNVGIMAQEEGYYIDVKLGSLNATSNNGDQSDVFSWFYAVSNIGSALEHGMLEQLQDGDTRPGASTVKLLQLNNITSKTYYVDNAGFDWGQLQNYESSTLSELQSLVSEGYRLVLPEDANIVLEQWQGLGYIKIFNDGNVSNIGMLIDGDFYGGYCTTSDFIDFIFLEIRTGSSLASLLNESVSNPPLTSKDPVDLGTGAFLYDHTDLSLGGKEPLGLQFSRSYNSGKNYDHISSIERRPLGFGWTHNYNIYAQQTSHGDPALGSRTAVDAASAIAGLYIIFDILSDNDNLQGWMASTLIGKWTVDQLINNAVSVYFGPKVLEYIKLADGSFNPPPGITSELIEDGNTYSLQGRFDTTIDFNTNNQISSWSDADGNTLTFSYNGNKLDTVVNDFGHSITLQYSGDQIQTVSDSSGRSVSFGYNTDNELVSYTDPEDKVWHYGYEPNSTHRMTILTNPLSITTATNTYDQLGRVDTQTVPRKIGGAVVNVTYNFYFSDFRNVEEDPDGNRTIYYYDEKGRNIGIENALGHKSTKEYDGMDHVVTATDQRMNRTSFEYDGDNNLIRILGPLTGAEYDIEYDYDGLFRKTDVHLSLNDVRQKLLSHLDYDSEHHLTGTIVYPEPGVEINNGSTFYPNGLTHTSTDGRGTVTTMTYDTYGSPDTSQTAYEPAVDYIYNSIGQLTDLIDQAGATTHFEYDDRGLITSKTDPLLKTTSYNYYDDGNLHTITDRNNDVTTYTYTPSGKMETITYQDASTVNFEYDIHDNLSEIYDAIGTTTFDLYDEANRLKSVTDPHGFTILYDYDEAGNIEIITYPGNKKVTYTYDELNRLDTVTIDWLGIVADYEYDTSGRLDSIDNFNGTFTNSIYDEANRLIGIENKKSDLSTISTYYFKLDANGNRTFIDQQEPLSPTPNANTTTYTYNTPRNRLLTAGSSNFGYDDEGQLNDKDGTSYAFDYEHRLKSISSSFSYSYDGMGKRLKAVRSGVETRYIYDAAGNLLAEADENNVISRYYIYGQGLLAMVTASDSIYCYHFNTIGSTIAMTDTNEGVVNSYAYTPFGIIPSEQETFSQPFKYVGQHGVMTEPNGLYYMRARYYDPSIGRFISEDPAGFGGGDINLYIYAGNNPIMLIDPLGLCSTYQPSNPTLYNGLRSTLRQDSGVVGLTDLRNTLQSVPKNIEWVAEAYAMFSGARLISPGVKTLASKGPSVVSSGWRWATNTPPGHFATGAFQGFSSGISGGAPMPPPVSNAQSWGQTAGNFVGSLF